MMRKLIAGSIIPALLLAVAGGLSAGAPERVNVRDFAHLAVDGDWSPAIQAALDSVNAENGFVRGATVYFPPGDYRVDETIVVGRNPEHWGLQLIGYGARLLGSDALYTRCREERFLERMAALRGLNLRALADERDIKPAIMELHNPPGFEGAGYVVEGLTFDRAGDARGVGIMIPAEEVPKGTTFRSIRVFGQEIGIYANHCYQLYFIDCIVRANWIGLLGQNHFNNIAIVNSIFRRNGLHGVQVGPNRGTWGSSAVHISGSIFESNRGYGILNAGGVQAMITGCYFESEANSIGVLNPLGNTTIDTCHFWGSYGHGWRRTPYSNRAHVVVGAAVNLQLRNNRYHGTPNSILITDVLQEDPRFGSSNFRFDARPTVAGGVALPDGFRVAADDGLSYYEFDARQGAFDQKSLVD